MKYLTFVACLVLAISIEIEGCDKVTTPQLVWNGSKGYHFGTYFKLNWYNAYEYCNYLGMELLTIDSVDEMKFIISTIQASGYTDESYWSSGTDLAKEGTYIWMSTGVTFAKGTALWTPNQPDNLNGNENCIELWNQNKAFLLNDGQCTLNHYPICQTTSNC